MVLARIEKKINNKHIRKEKKDPVYHLKDFVYYKLNQFCKVYELYPGPEFNRSQAIPDGIIDTDRVEQILNYNEFESEDLKELESRSEISMSMQNCPKRTNNSGLWIVPSYFNHSCVPNTTRFYLRDFVMFYAFRDIEKGEEITASYTGYETYESYQERQEVNIIVQ